MSTWGDEDHVPHDMRANIDDEDLEALESAASELLAQVRGGEWSEESGSCPCCGMRPVSNGGSGHFECALDAAIKAMAKALGVP